MKDLLLPIACSFVLDILEDFKQKEIDANYFNTNCKDN